MSNPRRTGLAALSALTFAASTPAKADVLDASAICGNTIEVDLGKNLSGVISSVGQVLGYIPQEASGGSHDLLVTQNAFYASSSGAPVPADNMMSDFVSKASADGVTTVGIGLSLCDHDAARDKTLLSDPTMGQAILVEGLEDYLDGASSDYAVSAVPGGSYGCGSIDHATGKVYVVSSISGSQIIQEWTGSGLSTISGAPSFNVGRAKIYDGDVLATDTDNSEAWHQGSVGSSAYTPYGASAAIVGHGSLAESGISDMVFYRGASGVEFCEAVPVEEPLAPELTALDDNLAMPISAGVSIPHDINAGDISLTAICEDSDATSPSELAIEIDANWETGEPAYMTSRGTTSPASTAISIQEGFEMTPDQLGEVSLAVECMDGDGLVDEIRNASYVVSAPTASGELEDGKSYDHKDALLKVETPGASATADEVIVEGAEDGDRISMSGLADALASFTFEGATIEVDSYSDSSVDFVIVAGISSGATGSPEGAPPPNADSPITLRVDPRDGVAHVLFIDADGTVIYDGEVSDSLDINTTVGGSTGGETGGDDGGGETGGDDGGSGSGVEGGETDGGDDGGSGSSVEGGGSGGAEGSGCATVSGQTPKAILAMIPLVLAAARRRQS